MARTVLAALVLLALAGGVRAGQALHARGLESIPMQSYRGDCGKKVPVSLAQVPGAGMDPKSLKPFAEVLKDGFFEVACVKDELHLHGDKFGGNKDSYGMSSNVSIVTYGAHVPREDQKPMSREVCFEFCRSVPDMSFFGLFNGRECYCTPYYSAMAGDSSMCDAVCPGKQTTMCGGPSKSSIFAMHLCANTAEVLEDAVAKAADLSEDLADAAGGAAKAAEGMQSAAEELQAKFGKAGDPTASNLLQSAKVFAGELQHAGEAASGAEKALAGLQDTAAPLKGADMKDAEKVREAEDAADDLEAGVAEAEAAVEHAAALLKLAGVKVDGDKSAGEGRAAQYTPLMYFVDKEFDEVPSTCGGDVIKKPILAQSQDECAAACDVHVHSCVGYSYYAAKGGNLCFLFSKFKTATYYTECPSCSKDKAPSFLQLHAGSCAVGCYAKLSEFQGTTLKPDPSGKCEMCLKKATAAARCYE